MKAAKLIYIGTAREATWRKGNFLFSKLPFVCCFFFSLRVIDSFLESSWICFVLATVLQSTPEQGKQLKFFTVQVTVQSPILSLTCQEA